MFMSFLLILYFMHSTYAFRYTGPSNQVGHNPFSGTNCTCEKFCNYECSINATNPKNVTSYRMTMHDVFDLADKDTGDIPGDTSFVIYQKKIQLICKSDPNELFCRDVAQFTGDSPNNTDLVLELTIEIDGQYGPYLACNPLDPKNPQTGGWNCSVDIDTGTPPNWPDQCTRNEYPRAWVGYAPMGEQPYKVLKDLTLGECCERAHYSLDFLFTYFGNNKTCALWRGFEGSLDYVGGDVFTSHKYRPSDICECDRVYKTVGAESHPRSDFFVAGGVWQSFPHGGECLDGHYVGDGSGCTYRVVNISKAIKASCLYHNFDTIIQSYNPKCFNKCDQPHNVSSTCWLQCFSDTIDHSTVDEITKPWGYSFDGACPLVKIPTVEF